MRFQAVNDTIILLKDRDESLVELPSMNDIREIPAPFTGTIDSVGLENEWKKGDRIAFCDMGGLYLRLEDKEYVVITPDMVIGRL